METCPRLHAQYAMHQELPFSPACERNKDAILSVLRERLPGDADVLEIASGTGQPVVHFAKALPRSSWQPSDVDPVSLDAIEQRIELSGLENILEPLRLDVTHQRWLLGSFDAVLCCNMTHISPWAATLGLLLGAADVMREGGCLHLYGPYKRNGKHTAPSNAAFDESLRSRDPSWGIRDLEEVASVAAGYGFEPPDVVEMPANNLFVSFCWVG